MPVRTSALQCIIPPHVYKAMLQSGEAQFGFAAQGLIDSTVIRTIRENTPPPDGGVARQPEFLVHTARNEPDLPGDLLQNPVHAQDEAARDVFAYLRHALQFFESLGRNSIDDRGMDVVATVHFRRNFPNAFWHNNQIVFGDGDRFFNRFTTSDIVGHELTHGVIQHTDAALKYQSQSGALNESFADVFGVLIRQRADLMSFESTRPQDWLVGRGMFLRSDFTPDRSIGIRSVMSPGTAYQGHKVLQDDPQVAHMRDFKVQEEDNGGVHIYSGIPNRAFYLVAEGLKGNAWDKPAKIWYAALLRLSPDATFEDMAIATLAAAEELGGAEVRDVVNDAWDQVGVSATARVASRGLSFSRGVSPVLEAAGEADADEEEFLTDELVSRIESRVLEAIERRVLENLESRLSERLDAMTRRIEDRLLAVVSERCGVQPAETSEGAERIAPRKKKSARKRPAKRAKKKSPGPQA